MLKQKEKYLENTEKYRSTFFDLTKKRILTKTNVITESSLKKGFLVVSMENKIILGRITEKIYMYLKKTVDISKEVRGEMFDQLDQVTKSLKEPKVKASKYIDLDDTHFTQEISKVCNKLYSLICEREKLGMEITDKNLKEEI